MSKTVRFLLTIVGLFACSIDAATVDEGPSAPDGWKMEAPRAEIRPQFAYRPTGGRDGKGSLMIMADEREGLDGYWVKTFAITGGRYYRFSALRKIENISSPRRSVVARVVWQDGSGKSVLRDTPVVSGYLKGYPPIAEPEYPMDKATGADGWTEVSDVYRAPSLNCICNGRRAARSNGAASPLLRRNRSLHAKCVWPRCTTARKAGKRVNAHHWITVTSSGR